MALPDRSREIRTFVHIRRPLGSNQISTIDSGRTQIWRRHRVSPFSFLYLFFKVNKNLNLKHGVSRQKRGLLNRCLRILAPSLIMSSLTKNPKGGRKGWTTPDQETWLKEQIPAYLIARAGGQRGLTPFRNKLYEGWFTRWPQAETSSSVTSGHDENSSGKEATELVRVNIFRAGIVTPMAD